jgi:hypothetical protein
LNLDLDLTVQQKAYRSDKKKNKKKKKNLKKVNKKKILYNTKRQKQNQKFSVFIP